MFVEIKELLLERLCCDELFNNKEIFYKEQIMVLMEQVVKLERKLQFWRFLCEEELFGDLNGVKEWVYRYDKFLVEKIILEIFFQKRECEFQYEVEVFKEEVVMF